jgi:GTP diphosphokinase / guanosine-3',5'-bis(diphosphate) 3'-diphosphatase
VLLSFIFVFEKLLKILQTQQIYSKYRALLLACKGTVSESDIPRIRKALDVVIESCAGRTTVTGDSLVIHALNVAKILAGEMGLGSTFIISALLHDSYDSITLTQREIKDHFGKGIPEILTGFSKISGLESMQASYQAENFRKLLLSMADDLRVILIKLVERLDYMRNLDRADEKERLPLASETYFLYAPLAHRLGFYNLKTELEDLSVKYLEPEQYTLITEKLKQTASSRQRLIREFSQPIRNRLDKQGFSYEIKGRNKSIHSILMKMKKQGVEFEEVYDLFAVRVIIESKPEHEKSDCWQVYSIVTDLYQPNPSRMRDWISVPKSNGYESLHTTVVGPRGKWVEVQIRTARMDEIAEKGIAAHYSYKGIKGESGFDSWLAGMKEIINSSDKEDDSFIDQVKSGLYSEEVFVFTPKGDLRQLQAGATVLDFAFDIHTDVGATCVGAKVNGKNVTIRYVLQNGDHVSILTSKNQKPKQDWLSFVISSKAKTKIKQYLNEEKALAAADGKEILMRRLKNWKMTYGDAVIKKLQTHYQLKTAQELYYMIAVEKIDLLELKEVLIKPETDSQLDPPGIFQDRGFEDISGADYADYLVIEDKVEGLDYRLSKCCNPVFGDRIFGFVTISEGIKIHRTSCPNAPYMMTKYPYRVVVAKWTKTLNMPNFRAAVRITGIEDIGIVNRIADIIGEFKVVLRSFNYTMEDGMFEGVLNIMVPNNNILQAIIKKILSIRGVLKVARQENV